MKNNYVFPAVFHANNDGSYTVNFPDLKGCITEGKSIEEALIMAESVLKQHLSVLLEMKKSIPVPTEYKKIKIKTGEFVNLIRVEIKDERAVRKTISIQKWQDDKITEDGLSLSRFVQDKLSERYAL